MITQSPKTVWTTHYDLAEADGEKARRKYPFDASRLPMPAPEYLIEVELATQDLVVRGKKLKSVDVISPEELGLPRHKIHLVHCWGKRIWGVFWHTKEEALRYFRIVGIFPSGRPMERLTDVLQNKYSQEDDLDRTIRMSGEQNERFDGRDFNRDDCECFLFSNANNLPLDALMKRTRRHYGVPWQ